MLYVCLNLTIAKPHNLDAKAIDFLIAFTQADLEEDIWMYLPIGFEVDGHTEAISERSSLLKLNKNVYGLKQGSYNWYEKLRKSCLCIGNVLFLMIGGTYFHLEPSHAVHTRLRKD